MIDRPVDTIPQVTRTHSSGGHPVLGRACASERALRACVLARGKCGEGARREGTRAGEGGTGGGQEGGGKECGAGGVAQLNVDNSTPCQTATRCAHSARGRGGGGGAGRDLRLDVRM